MNLLEYQKNLSLERIKPINLVQVEEEYIVSTFIEKLSGMASVRVLWGNELTLQDFINTLGEGALFEKKTQKELLFIKKGEQFIKRLKDPKLIRSLASRMKTKAVFIIIEEKLDKNSLQKEPFKTLLELGDFLEAKKLDKKKIKELVRKKVEREGKKIDEQALDYLLEITSYDLTFLKGEVEKLLLYADEKITLEDVKKVCLAQTYGNVFDFIEAFFTKDFEKVLSVLSSLYRMGTPALQIQALLVSYTLKLMVLKKSGRDPETLLKDLGVKHPFMIHNFKRYAEYFTEKELELLIKRLYWLDFAEKVAFVPPEKALRNMIVDYFTYIKRPTQ
ncbi:DNA polymerase III subunit delta [Thermocrinis sp.]